MKRFKGKTIVVTGGGIGVPVCRCLASEGGAAFVTGHVLGVSGGLTMSG